MLIYVFLIIALYGSKIELEQKLYTGVELIKDYPWLFDETVRSPFSSKQEEKSINIGDCRFESKSLLWPAHELFRLHLWSVTLEDPFNLSKIPLINNLFFHSLDHNDPEILKKCKFPPTIINLTFGKDALLFIKFVRVENFAKKVEHIRIHKESLKNLSKHEDNKIAKKTWYLIEN